MAPERRRVVVTQERPGAVHPLVIGRLAMAVHVTDGVTARAFGPTDNRRALVGCDVDMFSFRKSVQSFDRVARQAVHLLSVN